MGRIGRNVRGANPVGAPVEVIQPAIRNSTLLQVVAERIPARIQRLCALSHRLVARGLTHLEAVLLLFLAGAAFGLFAVFIMQARIAEGYQVGCAILLFAAWLLWKLERGPETRRDSGSVVEGGGE